MSIGPGRHEIAWILSLPARDVLVLGQRWIRIASRGRYKRILVIFNLEDWISGPTNGAWFRPGSWKIWKFLLLEPPFPCENPQSSSSFFARTP
jgi:hypothetical protein